MIMKVRGILFSISALVIAGTAVIYGFSVHSEASTPSINYKSNVQSSLSKIGTFETMNNIPISSEDFSLWKANAIYAAEINNQPLPSDAQILHDFNLNEALFMKAKSEGLEVSIQQAQGYSANVRNMMENPPRNANLASLKIVLQSIQDEENALGISDNKFWTEYSPKLYRKSLTIGALQAKFDRIYKTNHPNTDSAGLIQAWNSYRNQVFSAVSVVSTK